ncbi:hypothetical protein [Amycolatopsis magusensis]|uniref:Tat (Twin-arginine translocation) pathway signal sequence n=1 Tax=Amycolatopsis magusensis TaxID=882444 RepID=A0ABS4Q1P3_9PSEU|nr:hypothetical protein [Amycolatopsis magusensis]MBP2185590.1 hypothetical protein [Amycolatopsis magusensis]
MDLPANTSDSVITTVIFGSVHKTPQWRNTMNTAQQNFANGRRKFLKSATVAALGVVGLVAGSLLTESPAQATRQGALPTVGTEVKAGIVVEKAQLTIKGEQVETNFDGESTVRIETNPDDPTNSVKLKAVSHRLTADLPNGGTVTIEHNGDDANPQSVLKLTSTLPPKYEQAMVLNLKVTIDQPGNRIDQPLVLVTKEPMKLTGTPAKFPPDGDLMQLQNPIDLVLSDDLNTTIATIEKFPVKVTGV